MQNTPTVFLVEDDALLRELLADFLSNELAVECHSFERAEEALVCALGHKSPIDLLIADQLTPGQLSGTELAAMIQERWPGTPCIVMTGLEGSVVDLPAHTTYLKKPVAVAELIEAAVLALPKRSTGSRN